MRNDSCKRGFKPRLRAFDGFDGRGFKPRLRAFARAFETAPTGACAFETAPTGFSSVLCCRAKFCNQRCVFADLVSELLIHAE